MNSQGVPLSFPLQLSSKYSPFTALYCERDKREVASMRGPPIYIGLEDIV